MEPTITLSLESYKKMQSQIEHFVFMERDVSYALKRFYKLDIETLLKKYEEIKDIDNKNEIRRLVFEGKF